VRTAGAPAGADIISLWLYFGSSPGADRSSSAETFRDYAGVWHLDGDATDALGVADGNPSNVGWTTGWVQQSAVFDGASSWIDLGANNSHLQAVDYVRMCAVVRSTGVAPQSPGSDIFGFSMGGAPNDTSRATLQLETDLRPSFASRAVSGDSAKIIVHDSPFGAQEQRWLCGVVDFGAAQTQLWSNGSPVASASTSFGSLLTEDAPSASAAIGAEETGTGGYFAGTVDEVRVSTTRVNEATVRAESVGIDASYVTVSAVESQP
jgi:hypothetical protein